MKLITAQEVAKIMGCAESTIRTNAAKGTLGFPAVKVGKLWKFRDEEVYEYVYGKNWRDIVANEPQWAIDLDSANEPALEPATEKPAPVNVIPLGAREVIFNENSENLESCSCQI